jgi:nucleotide-binding universal stress UspA family protein
MAGREPRNDPDAARGRGPVLFAYDGSELAKHAILEAGRQLDRGRDALVVCVWQPVDVGFVVPPERHLHAAEAPEVRRAAEETAAEGAAIAEEAGFRARSVASEAAPTWKGILDAAEQHGADLVVLGSAHRGALAGRLLGSVTADVAKHCLISLLVVHRRAPAAQRDSL